MRRTNLFFAKVPKEHRGERTVGSRSGVFSSGYRGGILQIFRQQFLLVFLGLFLITGLILGVIFIRNADYSLLKTLDFVFFSNVKARSALPVLSIFVASLASSFLFLLFCFLCGLSIWGAYCVPLAPLFRGFGMGITAGYLYAAYGFQGFLFHLAVILPGASICLIAILIASRESMLFSKKMHFGRKTEEQEAQPKNNVRHFFIRFSILTGILIIGALVDVLSTVCFSGLFVF
ncbi:MAG: stage II sporulation protein M [Clostridium sp.]|nr:stage II sporulation protein M [Clostridium sp.]